MKNVAVFGSAGVLGKCVLEVLIGKGLNVRVLVRDSLQPLEEVCHERVEVVTGDVFNVVDVKATLEGQDAAIVILEDCYYVGYSTPMSEGWKNIIAMLEALNIKVVAFFLEALHSSGPGVGSHVLEIDSERRKILQALDVSNLHWIVAKCTQVVDQPSAGYSIVRGDSLRYVGNSGMSKQDLAQFLVDSLAMPEHYQKVITVCSNPIRQVFKDVLNFN